MTTQETKNKLDEIFKNSPEVSFNKYAADVENYSTEDEDRTSFMNDEEKTISFVEDAKILAVAYHTIDDDKSLLILHNNTYKVVYEACLQDADFDRVRIVEVDDEVFDTYIYNEDTQDFESAELTFEQVVLYSSQELMFPESNFFKMTEADAVKYPLT
jgi:hypothetical protein